MSDATGMPAEQVLGKAYDAHLMARLWPFVRPHWRLCLLALLLIPVAIGFEIAQPYLLKQAIDQHIAVHTVSGLGVIAALYVGCVLAQALASYGQLFALQLVGQRSMHALRLATYRHVITRRAAFYDKMPVGRLLTRMTNDVENINEMFASGVVTLIADFVKLAAIVGIMIYLDVQLTLITFLTLPLLVAVVAWARRIMRTSFREIRVKLAAMNAYLQEHLSGIKVVQLFVRERSAARAYDRINVAHRDAYLGAIQADSGMYAMVEAIGVGSAAGIVWYAGNQIGGGALTVGLVVAFVEYVNKFFIPVRDFSAKYTVMQSAMASAERIVALLDTEETDAPERPAGERAGTEVVEAAAGSDLAVDFDQVVFGYREGEEVLRGVSFRVPRGKAVAVVGATGSGKSTLIRLLTRLYETQGGQVRAFGRDVRDLPVAELRQRVAVVTQDVFLFTGTVAENVRLGRLDASDEEVADALARVGADRMLARRGVGPDAAVAERGANFSAGERQLIAFARALVRDPEVLILDEATAHVDPESERLIEKGLEALTEGRTNLIIAHRLSTIRRADHIVVLQRGRIAEQGSRAELMARGGLYARLERTFERKDDTETASLGPV
ncbi:MAG TPA: ABC transporter ATP-binding protein [Candidatus Acidoferrum sp.]|nr:ABC transporter ATP-binding protein [Candidatus Acidoferrum sp.]